MQIEDYSVILNLGRSFGRSKVGQRILYGLFLWLWAEIERQKMLEMVESVNSDISNSEEHGKCVSRWNTTDFRSFALQWYLNGTCPQNGRREGGI